MELTPPAHSEPDSAPASPSPLYKRAMLAGVALVGTSVIAVTPIVPAAPALAAAAQTRDVQLTAASNPLTTWQNALQTSFGHIQYGLNEMSTMYPVYFQDILGGGSTLLQELAGSLINVEGWQQLAADLPGYAEQISEALAQAQEDSQSGSEHAGDSPVGLDGFGEMVENVFGYLSQAQFNYALAEFNQYFLWSLGSGAWPLFDLLEIPGKMADTLGAGKLANVFDVLLTDNALGHVTEAVLGPIVTTAFQFTEALDDLVAAVSANDWETAATELLDMPGKVVNAYLNGFTPRVAAEDGKDWPWQGILTAKGTIEHFLFNVPRDLAWALSTSREDFLAAAEAKKNPDAATAVSEELSEAASTELAPESDLVPLQVDSPRSAAQLGAGALAQRVRAAFDGATESATEETKSTAQTKPASEETESLDTEQDSTAGTPAKQTGSNQTGSNQTGSEQTGEPESTDPADSSETLDTGTEADPTSKVDATDKAGKADKSDTGVRTRVSSRFGKDRSDRTTSSIGQARPDRGSSASGTSRSDRGGTSSSSKSTSKSDSGE